MSRRCMITNDTTGEKCLGHPPVDDERYPPICDGHLDAIFGWLIRVKADQLASQRLHEMLRGRPRGRREHQQAVIHLRPGATLTEQDQATLAFLTGRAA